LNPDNTDKSINIVLDKLDQKDGSISRHKEGDLSWLNVSPDHVSDKTIDRIASRATVAQHTPDNEEMSFRLAKHHLDKAKEYQDMFAEHEESDDQDTPEWRDKADKILDKKQDHLDSFANHMESRFDKFHDDSDYENLQNHNPVHLERTEQLHKQAEDSIDYVDYSGDSEMGQHFDRRIDSAHRAIDRFMF
jgi:hypothetical protein